MKIELPTGRIAVRWLPVDSLKPDPRNARVHSERQVAGIADSIAAFGFNVPLLVDRKGGVPRGPRTAARGQAPRARRSPHDHARTPRRGRPSRLHDRRQPARRARLMGRPAACPRAQGAGKSRPRLRAVDNRLRARRDRPADQRRGRSPSRSFCRQVCGAARRSARPPAPARPHKRGRVRSRSKEHPEGRPSFGGRWIVRARRSGGRRLEARLRPIVLPCGNAGRARRERRSPFAIDAGAFARARLHSAGRRVDAEERRRPRPARRWSRAG